MSRAALILVLVACTAAKPPEAPATPKDVVAAGRAVVEQWKQGYEVRSVEALAKLYAHDLDVTVVQEGQALLGWKSIETALKDRLAHAGEIRVRLKDVQVTAQGLTLATVVATMTRETIDGATTVTETGTLSLVLRKDPEGWVIALEHYSYRRS